MGLPHSENIGGASRGIFGGGQSRDIFRGGPVKKIPKENIAKGTTDPRVEFISQVLTHFLIKFQFQNLDLALTSKPQPNVSILKLRILTKASFRILTWPRFNFVTSTKNQQQNTNQTSASKSFLNFNFKSWPKFLLKIWTKVSLYDQTSATKSATNCC